MGVAPVVIMRSPYTGGTVTVSVSNVERFTRNGWVVETPLTPRGTAPRGAQTVTSGKQNKNASKPTTHVSAPVVGDSDAPKGNASRAAWRDYAESLGIETEGLNRAQLRDAVAAHQNRG